MSTKITDEQCHVNGGSGARFCIDCRLVIYIGSTLSEDAYYTDSDGYYHHVECPPFEPDPPRSSNEDEGDW